MVVIRLQPFGKKDDHSYRIVVTDSRKPVSGDYITCLGNYYTHAKQADDPWIVLNLDEYDLWVSKGAQPSETVKALAKRYRRNRSFNPKIEKIAVPAAHKKSIRKQTPFPKANFSPGINPLEEFAWVCRWLVTPTQEVRARIAGADVSVLNSYLSSVQPSDCALLACDVLAKYLDMNCLRVDRDSSDKYKELLLHLISSQVKHLSERSQISSEDRDLFRMKAIYFVDLLLDA